MGSAYEYRRGTETAANSFFNKCCQCARLPRADQRFCAHQSGADNQDKAFFFVNYEGRRDASSTSVTRAVPNDLLRAGSVSYHGQQRARSKCSLRIKSKRLISLGIGDNPACFRFSKTFTRTGMTLHVVMPSNTTCCIRFNTPQHSNRTPISPSSITKWMQPASTTSSCVAISRTTTQMVRHSFQASRRIRLKPIQQQGHGRRLDGGADHAFVSTFRYGFTRSAMRAPG